MQLLQYSSVPLKKQLDLRQAQAVRWSKCAGQACGLIECTFRDYSHMERRFELNMYNRSMSADVFNSCYH